MPETPVGWLLALVLWVLVYEAVRRAVLGAVQRRMQGGALRFVRRHQVRLDSARFIDRLWLRERLMQDPVVEEALVEAARQRGVPEADLRAKVAGWVQEIVPAFSLAAYYRFGAAVARTAVDLVFELAFDRARFEQQRARVPDGAVVVYVMNHRSNADYVVLSYGLVRHVALSYAVGEWARVWPLDVLFRAFGSFFVRRGEQDRLYHTVLERYVQILLGNGGTTGFFIEGRLTRTGALATPKAGLLDYIVGVRRQDPGREIAFVPIGLNYDHVLEDASLVRERPDAAPPGPVEKLRSLVWLVVGAPWRAGRGAVKVALRSDRRAGLAAVAVGEPLLLTAWERRRLGEGPGLAARPFEERRPLVKDLAADLLAAVGGAVPATAVPVLCLALLQDEDAAVSAVRARVRLLLAGLRAAGATVALGGRFSGPTEAASGIDGLEAEVSAVEEAEQLVSVAGHRLARRGLVRHEGGRLAVVAGNEDLVRYYARSIAHHVPDALPAGL